MYITSFKIHVIETADSYEIDTLYTEKYFKVWCKPSKKNFLCMWLGVTSRVERVLFVDFETCKKRA